MNQTDPSWQKQVKATLDRKARELDGQTMSQLNRARQHALDEARHAPRARWLPAGLLSAAAVLTLAIGLGLRAPGPVSESDTALEVVLLTSDEPMEMLEQLEFYAWLDSALSDAG